MTQQILRNTGAALSQTFYSDEAPITADGAVTVTVTRSTGAVVSTGPATLVGDAYRYSLPPQTQLGQLTLTWEGTFAGLAQSLASTVEIVGGFYVALAEIRALPNLGDVAQFPTAKLIEARQWFETTFETYVGAAFVPRAATARVNGSGSEVLRLNRRPVRSVTAVRIFTSATASTAYTAAELADVIPEPGGYIRRASLGYWSHGSRNIEVDYVHGMESAPADLKREALVAIQEHLMENNSGRPTDRTYGTATDGVFVRSILPDGDKHPFGIASVDALAVRYRDKHRIKFASISIA